MQRISRLASKHIRQSQSELSVRFPPKRWSCRKGRASGCAQDAFAPLCDYETSDSVF